MDNAIDYLVVIVYFIPMLAAGYWGYRRAKDPDEYLVAGRRLGPVMYTGTLAAMTLGGASTIGSVALGYRFGISGMWLAAMLGLGAAALSTLFARQLTNLGVYSFADILELRYQPWTGTVGAIIMGVFMVMSLVTQVLAIGTLFNVFFDLSPTLAILAAGGTVLLYSVAGGMWSISLTDIIQFVMMSVGIFFLLLPIAISQAGGFGALQEELPASYFDITAIGWNIILAYFFTFFLGIMIGQETWQRVFTARDDRVARWGGLVTGAYCVAYGLAGALIGCAARVLLPSLDSPDAAFAAMATTVLPAGVRGLVLAAALAAVMSTASALLLAASTVLANNVYTRIVRGRSTAGVAVNRVFMLLVGGASFILAILVGNVVGALQVAFSLLVSATFVPVVGALLWKRATAAGALASMVAGSAVVVVLLFTHGVTSNVPVTFGLLASLVAFIAVSLLTPRMSSEKLAAWERRMRGSAVAGNED